MIYGDKIWEKLFASKEWGKYPPEEVIRYYFFVSNQLGEKNIKALDIGSGKGACSWFLKKGCAEVTAFEGAPAGLKSTNKVALEFNVKDEISLLHGDITEPKNYINSKFELLLDNYALYSNEENKIKRALEEYYDLTAQSGFFLMNCFGEKTTGFGSGKQLSDNTWIDISNGIMKERGIVTWFTKKRLFDSFQKIGFSISYYENILIERNQNIIEKHSICFKK